MRDYVFITIILIIFATPFFACDNKTNEKLQENNEVNADKQVQGEICGVELITDEQFKRELLEYLAFVEKLDYINIYSYLSKDFLKKFKNHFPTINNAEEYKNFMENKSERGTPKYLEITKWRESKKDEYEVELIFETNAEGEMVKIEALYYFVNENGKWKFNNRKLMSYLYLERGDKTWKAY